MTNVRKLEMSQRHPLFKEFFDELARIRSTSIKGRSATHNMGDAGSFAAMHHQRHPRQTWPSAGCAGAWTPTRAWPTHNRQGLQPAPCRLQWDAHASARPSAPRSSADGSRWRTESGSPFPSGDAGRYAARRRTTATPCAAEPRPSILRWMIDIVWTQNHLERDLEVARRRSQPRARAQRVIADIDKVVKRRTAKGQCLEAVRPGGTGAAMRRSAKRRAERRKVRCPSANVFPLRGERSKPRRGTGLTHRYGDPEQRARPTPPDR